MKNEIIESKKTSKEVAKLPKEKKPRKKFRLGTAFKEQIAQMGKGGWLLFFTMFLSLFIMVAACLAVFFTSVQGEEKVKVPDVLGKSLVAAQLELQAKELYPKLMLKYSEIPGSEGMVIDMDPGPGSITKAYHRVTLTVSRGVQTEAMPDYVGKDADEAQTKLNTEFAGSSVVTVAPIVYQKSDKPAGTILTQSPKPKTSLDDPVTVHFVVSSGDKQAKTTVPDLTGKSLPNVLTQLEKSPLVFDFTAHTAGDSDTPGTVSSQSIREGEVDEFTRVQIDMAFPAPTEEDTSVYGIFSYTLNEYPYPVPVRVEASDNEGNITKLADFMHPGKEFTIPYNVKKNSVITLYVMGESTARHTVQ